MLTLVFSTVNTAHAQELVETQPLRFQTVEEVKAELKKNIELYIRLQAREHGVDENMAVKVARCESGLSYTAIGDNGKSFGLWQIHEPSHKLAKEIMLDPIASTKWAMPRLKETPKIWTCFRRLHA